MGNLLEHYGQGETSPFLLFHSSVWSVATLIDLAAVWILAAAAGTSRWIFVLYFVGVAFPLIMAAAAWGPTALGFGFASNGFFLLEASLAAGFAAEIGRWIPPLVLLFLSVRLSRKVRSLFVVGNN